MMLADKCTDSRDAVQNTSLAERVSTEGDMLLLWRYGDVRTRVRAADVVSITPTTEKAGGQMQGGSGIGGGWF